MKLAAWVADLSVRRRGAVVGVTLACTLLVGLAAALPSLWPAAFPSLHAVRVDTDPENMLSEDEAARVFHRKTRELFQLHDMVVVGVVDDEHQNGVFHERALAHVHDLAEYAKTLRWKNEDGEEVGVVGVDLLAPSTVDDISQGGLGSVRFEWMMPKPPDDCRSSAARYATAHNGIPFLNGTLVSEDGRAIATLRAADQHKHLSYRVATAAEGAYRHLQTAASSYHITGLPDRRGHLRGGDVRADGGLGAHRHGW